MRALMRGRKNFYSLPGGDTIQLFIARVQLESVGVKMNISLSFNPSLSSYDIMHNSNITRMLETYLHMQNAKRQYETVALLIIFFLIKQIDNENLYGLYKICMVNAFPNWFDTPGLVSLETGMAGYNLAVNTGGSIAKCVKNYAEYRESGDISPIRSAVG